MTVATRFHYDSGDDRVYLSSTQDVEPILELNKAMRAERQRSDWGRHIASIPNIICLKWLHEEWAKGNVGLRYLSREFDELVERKLRDPEWKYLRTDERPY